MGLFSFLPFVADDPKPAAPRPRVLQRAAAEKPVAAPGGRGNAPTSSGNRSNAPASGGGRGNAPTSNRRAPTTTGRDPGRTPGGGNSYPGANTNRPKPADKAKWSPVADPVYQALVDAGWEIPSQQRTAGASNLDSLDMSKATDLKGYDYQITNDEWGMLQGAASRAGYKGPTGTNKAPPTVKGQALQAVPMTWDAYNALSDDQRKAVDFNTLLVEARQKDLSAQNPGAAAGNPTEYGEKVSRIFGKGGGSARPAANTVNLLDKIGLEASGQDLDEFMSLERAVTWDELQNFKFTEGEVVGLTGGGQQGKPRANSGRGVTPTDRTGLKSNIAEVRSVLNQARIDTSAIDKAGAFLDAAFGDSNTSLWDISSTANAALTGTRPADVKYGYGLPGERADPNEDMKEQIFQGLYGVVQDKNTTDIQSIWDAIDEHGVKNWTDEDTAELWDYFNTRSVTDNRAGLGAGDSTIRNSTEIRQFLGL